MNPRNGLLPEADALFASPRSLGTVSPPAVPSPTVPSDARGLEARASGGDGLVIVVYGIPGPQGSKSFKGMRTNKSTGKTTAVLAESSKKVKPWRALVAKAADDLGIAPLAGALEVQMVFTVKPPQRMPKDRIYPTCYPDTSKLIRSTEDALTGRAWADDAQVIRYRDTGKYYPGQHPDALSEPGVVIRIWTLDGAA